MQEKKKASGMCVYIFQCPVLSHQLLEWNPNGVTFFLLARFGFYGFANAMFSICNFFPLSFPEASLQMKDFTISRSCALCSIRWDRSYHSVVFQDLCIRFSPFYDQMVIFGGAFFIRPMCTNIELVYITSFMLSIFNRIGWESKFT